MIISKRWRWDMTIPMECIPYKYKVCVSDCGSSFELRDKEWPRGKLPSFTIRPNSQLCFDTESQELVVILESDANGEKRSIDVTVIR